MPRMLTFADEFAPVWTDPLTGAGGPWTAARFRAAGFEVRDLPGVDLHAVDLDSRRAALEDGDATEGTVERPPEPPQPHGRDTGD